MSLSKLKDFEDLNFYDQIDKVSGLLENAGFMEHIVRCKGGALNIYYVKDDCDYVFAVIITKKKLIQAVVIDKSVYEEQIEGKHRRITLKSRNDTSIGDTDGSTVTDGRKYVPVFSDKVEPLHRFVINAVEKDKGVDHVTHSLSICTRDYLRTCDSWQNKVNTACYSRIDTKSKRFTSLCGRLSNEGRLRYGQLGYSFDHGYITSPSFGTFAELYKAVDEYENRYLGEFRYKPLYDFSETFYAFVAWKMLGWGSEVEITEYNRDYMLRKRREVAEYYCLGA